MAMAVAWNSCHVFLDLKCDELLDSRSNSSLSLFIAMALKLHAFVGDVRVFAAVLALPRNQTSCLGQKRMV